MTASPNSITIAVPALNEEDRLESAVSIIVAAAEKWFDDYEVLVFDDGSTDRTGEVADRLAEKHERVTAIHHDKPHCVGGVVREGLRRARMNYFIWVDGRGATTAEALDRIFSLKGQADLIVPYPTNQCQRRAFRRAVSWTFRALLNAVFRLHLRYYNHLVLCPAAVAAGVNVRTNSYAHQAERLIKLIKSGCTYVQVPIEDNYATEGKRTKAFRLSNIAAVFAFFVRTFWEVYVLRKYRPKGPKEANQADARSRQHA